MSMRIKHFSLDEKEDRGFLRSEMQKKLLLIHIPILILYSSCASTGGTSSSGTGNQSQPSGSTAVSTTQPDSSKERAVNADGTTGNAANSGCIQGDCENGTGIYIYPNGDKYTGQFVNGKRQGSGQFVYANGDRFQGFFVNDMKDGLGIYSFKNGDVFNGNFKNGMREGNGRYTFPDGHYYEGKFENDGGEGVGEMKEKDSNISRKCSLKNRTIYCESTDDAPAEQKPAGEVSPRAESNR